MTFDQGAHASSPWAADPRAACPRVPGARPAPARGRGSRGPAGRAAAYDARAAEPQGERPGEPRAVAYPFAECARLPEREAPGSPEAPGPSPAVRAFARATYRAAVPCGRLRPAAAVVAADGRIAHWSTDAVRLFGSTGEEAVGALATDLLPLNPLSEEGVPRSGWARMPAGPLGEPHAILWWSYPLPARPRERALVLAADAAEAAAAVRAVDASGRPCEVVPDFAPLGDLPEPEALARDFGGALPRMGPGAAERIARNSLELGYPVLEFSTRIHAAASRR